MNDCQGRINLPHTIHNATVSFLTGPFVQGLQSCLHHWKEKFDLKKKKPNKQTKKKQSSGVIHLQHVSVWK